MSPENTTGKEFFVSYTGSNEKIAEWIAWVLEKVGGYPTIFQKWDFKAGAYFPLDMHKAETKAKRTIAVLSQAYMESEFCQSEWAAAFAEDPDGEAGKLIPVKVEDFEPPGNFKALTHINLAGLEEDAAQELLLSEIRCRIEDTRKVPPEKPPFRPVTKRTASKKNDFTVIPLTFKPLFSLPARPGLISLLLDLSFEMSQSTCHFGPQYL